MKNGCIFTKDHRYWYKDGEVHREDGPAIEFSSFEGWFINGLCHILEGPAKIWKNGDKEWWINGQIHRLEGPAALNSGEELWYIRNNEYTPEEHPFNIFRIEYYLSKEYEEWPNEYKVLFKMIYGGL